MSQATLFLLTVALSGLWASRWMLRLVPPGSELALKTVGASALAGLVAASAWLPFAPSQGLLLFTLVVTPVYVFAPLFIIALGRWGAHRAAAALGSLLYWTRRSRHALRRLLAQAALQQGDAGTALELVPPEAADELMLAQAYALAEQWDKVLSLQVPAKGDNAFLAMDARVQAYLALGRLPQAEAELQEMRERLERQPGPIGFRSVALAEARVAAERGQLEQVRERLGNPPPGVPHHLVFALAARAAEQAGETAQAAAFYRQAYALAPEGLRARYGAKLTAYGEALPAPLRVPRPYGTLALLASLVLAYLAQLWLDRSFGPFRSSAGGLQASSVVGAFMLNIQGVPEAGAFWRYLAYAFLHGNLLHIGFNGWVLLDIGRIYEARRNWGNLLASFTLGTWLGAYLTLLTDPGQPLLLVGASGGILGIAGALLADAWRGGAAQDRLLTRSLLQWMVILMLFSLAVPNVSLWGHVGGVIGGLLWGFIRQGLPKARGIDLAAGLLSLGLLLYALAQAARVFAQYVR